MASKGTISLSSDFELVYEEADDLEAQKTNFKIFEDGIFRISPGKFIAPKCFLGVAKDMHNFKFQPTDVIVMSYPKCGSTWMQEILWTMLNNPNFDHPHANLVAMFRCPFFDMDGLYDIRRVLEEQGINAPGDMIELFPDYLDKSKTFLNFYEAMKPPRVFKTHLTPSILDSSLLTTAKVVYMIRNPRDVLLSFYPMARLLKGLGFKGTLDEFVEYFVGDGILYSPYNEHIREVLKKLRGHPNILFVFYEDLKRDTYGEMQRLQAFLGTELTEQTMKKIIDYTHIDQMKARDDMSKNAFTSTFKEDVLAEDGLGFFRTGDDKNKNLKLSKESETKFKAWAEANLSDLNLPYTY